MAASNEWTEWHLTNKGWVRGSERRDFQPTKKVDAPIDSVMTCEYKEYASSIFSKLEESFSVLRRSKDSEKVNALLENFGECPQSL